MAAPSARPPDPDVKTATSDQAGGGGNYQGRYGKYIIQFVQPRRNCVGGGVSFRALRPAHTLCRRCYSWELVGHYASLVAATIRGVR